MCFCMCVCTIKCEEFLPQIFSSNNFTCAHTHTHAQDWKKNIASTMDVQQTHLLEKCIQMLDNSSKSNPHIHRSYNCIVHFHSTITVNIWSLNYGNTYGMCYEAKSGGKHVDDCFGSMCVAKAEREKQRTDSMKERERDAECGLKKRIDQKPTHNTKTCESQADKRR